MRGDTGAGERIVLVNNETDEQIEIQFRPESVAEQVEVGYSRVPIIGLSHQPLQYTGTGNRKLPAMVFRVDQHFMPSGQDVMALRRFLLAATVEETEGGGPARVTVVWPGVITFTGVITSVAITHETFSDEGVTGYTATAAFEEWVPTRRMAADYRRGGL